MTDEQEHYAIAAARKAVHGHYGTSTTEINVGVLCELIALASLPSNPEHDTYGAPPVGALTDEDERYTIERAADLLEGYADWIKRTVMSAQIEEHPYLPEIEGTAEDLRALAAASGPVSMDCEDCNGTGEVGDEIYQGDFQPPERERCTSCDGSGRWKLSPTPAPSEAVKGVSTAEPSDADYLRWAKQAGATTTYLVKDGPLAVFETNTPWAKFCNTVRSVHRELAAPSHPPATPDPDAEILQVIDERDRYHEMADDLAAQIAAITGEEIGEHSSANDPWRNAMLAADEFITKQIRKLLTPPATPAVAVQAEPARKVKIEPGSELHFALLGAPMGWNFLTGKDYADMQAFALAVWNAALAAHPKPAAQSEGEQP